MLCCTQPPPPQLYSPIHSPTVPKAMREVQTKPKGRGGRWETTPKISAASPEIGTWPSVSQAEGRVGVPAVLGIRCGWEKDASDPNHNVGAAGGDTRTPLLPPGALHRSSRAAASLYTGSGPRQGQQRPGDGTQIPVRGRFGGPGSGLGAGSGSAPPPPSPSHHPTTRRSSGSLQVPPERGFAAGLWPTFSLRSRVAAGWSGACPVLNAPGPNAAKPGAAEHSPFPAPLLPAPRGAPGQRQLRAGVPVPAAGTRSFPFLRSQRAASAPGAREPGRGEPGGPSSPGTYRELGTVPSRWRQGGGRCGARVPLSPRHGVPPSLPSGAFGVPAAPIPQISQIHPHSPRGRCPHSSPHPTSGGPSAPLSPALSPARGVGGTAGPPHCPRLRVERGALPGTSVLTVLGCRLAAAAASRRLRHGLTAGGGWGAGGGGPVHPGRHLLQVEEMAHAEVFPALRVFGRLRTAHGAGGERFVHGEGWRRVHGSHPHRPAAHPEVPGRSPAPFPSPTPTK